VGSAIRLSQALTDQVDDWGEKQMPPLSRSEAIRALIERGLKRDAIRDAPVFGGVSSGAPKPIRQGRR